MSSNSSGPFSSVEVKGCEESTNSLHEDLENSNRDNLVDFNHHNSTDRIYREYDPPRLESFAASWKAGRPTFVHSCFRCIRYSFIFTVLYGAGTSVVTIFIIWLSLNLGAICRHFDGTWYEMPVSIQKALLTLEVAEGMIVQCWFLSIIVPIFGWKLVKELNLLSWTMLAASIDAVYRLLLNVFRTYNRTWSSYPMNFLFATSFLFISYKVASQYRQNIRQRLQLAFKLGVQFYVSLPVALIINYVVLHYFNLISEKSKAILASLAPAFVIIPKAITRLCAEKMEGLNHPGTSILLLLSTHAGMPVLFRILQTKLHGFWMYFLLSIIHGIESTFDKITLPLQDYILHRCCTKGQRGYTSKEKKPRVNRLFADLAIINMIAESSAIIVSSVVTQMCRYYYSRDEKGRAHNVVSLLEVGCWQIITAIIVEFVFNTIAVKIQTYYYNVPIMRVWKIRKRWLFAMFIIQTLITILYFGGYFLNTLRNNKVFDERITHVCKQPFHTS